MTVDSYDDLTYTTTTTAPTVTIDTIDTTTEGLVQQTISGGTFGDAEDDNSDVSLSAARHARHNRHQPRTTPTGTWSGIYTAPSKQRRRHPVG